MTNDTGITLLRRKQVQAITGLSRSSIYLMIQRGTFPRPVLIGSRSVAWSSQAVHNWIAAKLAQEVHAQAQAAADQGRS